MISDVDASLSALLRAEVLQGTETEVVFDAPTTDWASRRSGSPTVDVFLYDIREDPARRDIAMQPQRDMTGRITGRRPGIRHFRLSYLLTAWTRRPEDEHRLLGQLLEALLQFDRVPTDYLRGRFIEDTIVLNMAQPPAPDRSLADIWNALGGDMKPSLDLVAIAPVRPGRVFEVGPPVLEQQVRVLRRPGDRPELPSGVDGDGTGPVDGGAEAAGRETASGETAGGRPGRSPSAGSRRPGPARRATGPGKTPGTGEAGP
ncbi:MAG: hypothetical protein V7637_5408 [Mycobacteriales bacterium]